jgi:HAD superfamily hydrolase (TIGR01509 family)
VANRCLSYTPAVIRSLDAIVFDLDGTLVASHDLIAQTINRVLVSQDLPAVDPEAVHAMTGLPLATIFRSVLPAAAAESELACVDLYRQLFEQDVLPVLAPIPGALETVTAVASLAPLAVATGRLTSTAEQIMLRCKLDSYFGVVLGSDLAARPKPFPDLLLLVLERLGGIDPARVLVVGDSSADVAMARAAGAYACAVTWGAQSRSALLKAEPHWCIDRWDELIALISG